jgi:hypothetical protein
MPATPTLTHLTNEVLLDSFCPENFIGIGVSIGTGAFVRSFVVKTCRDIIDDVEKLDEIQDGFIHYQLLRFCQTTRFQYINSHIMLSNHCVLQQRHVDCKIADTLLKKGTKHHGDGWDSSSIDWAHMCMGSCQEEHLISRSQESVVTTVEESVLKMEMSGLESQEEDDPKRILFFKPMSWLGKIRPHRRDESWSTSL